MQATQQVELRGHSPVGYILPLDVPVRAPVQTAVDGFHWKDFFIC